MSITTPWKSRLAAAVTAGDTTLTVTDDVSAVCACLAVPSHMFATIYTAQSSERVLITGCTGTTLLLSRGFNGTTAQAWPANACLLIDTVVDGAVVSDEECCGIDAQDVFSNQLSSDQNCDLSATFDELNTGKGLEIDRTNPNVPVLQLAATGVTPGNYGGAVVNECGQLTSIPLGWPSNALADFNPCCDEGTAGAATTAAQVSYAPATGSTVATGLTVQAALQQIDDAFTNLVLPNAGVQSVTAGTGVAVTGTAADPVVGLANTGITAGVYDGFTVNAQGQITNYTAPTGTTVTVTGVAPISVTQAGTNFDVSISGATKTQQGAALLADEANLNGNEAAIGGDNVVTWDFLQLWQTLNAGIATVEAGHDAIVVAFDGVATYTITAAIDLVTADNNPIVVAHDNATGKFTVGIQEAAIGQYGAVQIADPATAIATPTAANASDVVNVDFLEQWAAARGI